MTTLTTETITVEDIAGLDALPVGTVICDAYGEPYEKQEDGGYLCTEVHFGSTRCTVSVERASLDLPATVENPEVLGSFASDTETIIEALDRLNSTILSLADQLLAALKPKVCNEEDDEPVSLADLFAENGIEYRERNVFGLGDRVTITKDGDSWYDQEDATMPIALFGGLGETGEIVEVDALSTYAGNTYRVRLDSGDYKYVRDVQIELASIPESLDEPLADWEQELLDSARAAIQVGDLVKITGPSYATEFEGRVGRVIETENLDLYTYMHLVDGQRPDGHGDTSFYWDTDKLVRVPTTYAVGDDVIVAESGPYRVGIAEDSDDLPFWFPDDFIGRNGIVLEVREDGYVIEFAATHGPDLMVARDGNLKRA